MLWAPRMSSGWTRTAAGLLAMVATVSLPVEITVRLIEQPVLLAPRPVVTFLTIGSCMLLVWSGLGLRRLEAARALGRRPTLGR